MRKTRHSQLPTDPAPGFRGTQQKGGESGTSQAEILSVAQTAKVIRSACLPLLLTAIAAERKLRLPGARIHGRALCDAVNIAAGAHCVIVIFTVNLRLAGTAGMGGVETWLLSALSHVPSNERAT